MKVIEIERHLYPSQFDCFCRDILSFIIISGVPNSVKIFLIIPLSSLMPNLKKFKPNKSL